MKKNNQLSKLGVSKYVIGATLGISLLLPLLVIAQTSPFANPSDHPGRIITSPTDISRIVSAVFGWLAGIIFTVSLIMLFYSAILFMTAGASETIHGKAKNVLIYAVVGLAVAILTFSFKPFLETFFRGNF